MSAGLASTPIRGRRRPPLADDGQMALFDASGVAPRPASEEPKRAAPTQRREKHKQDVVMIGVRDMPIYPPQLHAVIDSMLADLDRDRVLFTYRAIQDCFGISRSTVARRVKEGLVPGVRMRQGRVLDDGPVRRFDRAQLRWLLLAVRFAKRHD